MGVFVKNEVTPNQSPRKAASLETPIGEKKNQVFNITEPQN